MVERHRSTEVKDHSHQITPIKHLPSESKSAIAFPGVQKSRLCLPGVIRPIRPPSLGRGARRLAAAVEALEAGETGAAVELSTLALLAASEYKK